MNVDTKTVVCGQSRFKYFERPIISEELQEQQLPDPNIILARIPKLLDGAIVNDDKINCKSIAIQTDYRDSEAQTDPYSPEYTYDNNSTKATHSISAGTNKPEILILENLTYSNGGLPNITPRVIEKINLERKRRIQKANLPPIQYDNEESLNLHQKFLEDVQREDYELRERDLDMDVTKRLLEFQNLQQEKENAMEQLNSERLKVIKDKKMKDHEVEIERYKKKISICQKSKINSNNRRRGTLRGDHLIQDIKNLRNNSIDNKNNDKIISSERQIKNTTIILKQNHHQHQLRQHNKGFIRSSSNGNKNSSNTFNKNNNDIIDDEIVSSIMTGSNVTRKKVDYSKLLQSTNKSDIHNRDALKLANDLNLIDSIYNKNDDKSQKTN